MKGVLFTLFVTLLMMEYSFTYSQEIGDFKVDTLRYLSVDKAIDTFFCERTYLSATIIRDEEYHGRDAYSRMTSGRFIYVIGDSLWMQVIGNDTIKYLSIEDFVKGKKSNWFVTEKLQKGYYYEYTPIRKLKVNGNEFYLYSVRHFLDDKEIAYEAFHIVFNFKRGLIFIDINKRRKILKGFENYVKYFEFK